MVNAASSSSEFVSPDVLRTMFSRALSRLYATEVPLYGDLVNLVNVSGNTTDLSKKPTDRHFMGLADPR